MIRKSGNRFSLAKMAQRFWADIMLKKINAKMMRSLKIETLSNGRLKVQS